MPMSAFTDEEQAHFQALLKVLEAAQVPTHQQQDSPKLGDRLVCALPALVALQVSFEGFAYFRAWLAKYTLLYGTYTNPDGEAFVVVALKYLVPLLAFSSHPVGQAYAAWDRRVEAALAATGWYDPARHHEPSTGDELGPAGGNVR
jgi:hypothetical protein